MAEINWVHYGRDARQIEQRVLELNYLENKKKELQERINELRAVLTDDLVFCEDEKYATVDVTAVLSRRMEVRAVDGSMDDVYELLSARGYDVSVYNYKKLVAAVRVILEADGELPDWLDTRIEPYEHKYITLRRHEN